jgi:hypothetical protein
MNRLDALKARVAAGKQPPPGPNPNTISVYLGGEEATLWVKLADIEHLVEVVEAARNIIVVGAGIEAFGKALSYWIVEEQVIK